MTRSALDWLSQLMSLMTVRGQLEIRCAYGAPWQVVYEDSAPGEMPYHVILRGSAVWNCRAVVLRSLYRRATS